MVALSPESVKALYLGFELTITERDVVVRPVSGGRPVRVASIGSARRLVRSVRRSNRNGGS